MRKLKLKLVITIEMNINCNKNKSISPVSPKLLRLRMINLNKLPLGSLTLSRKLWNRRFSKWMTDSMSL